MSRHKSSARLSDNEQVMTQVWHGLVDTLRLLPSIPSKTIDDRPSPSASERQIIADALDKVSLLISLRRGEGSTGPTISGTTGTTTSTSLPATDHATPSTAAVPTISLSQPSASSTPTSAALPANYNPSLVPIGTGTGGGNKRKRRPSISSSPAPAALLDGHGHGHGHGTGSRGATPMSREQTGKLRKEPYSDQLPLQPGRRIAFRVPAEKSGGVDQEVTWILATVKRCLNGDRSRYEVQDADDHELQWSTTLRSIIPLPDPDAPTHLSSHPLNLEDFPRHSTVLAMYPETTSFYQATVVSAPIPGTGMGGPPKPGARADPGAKKGVYRLTFVDDGNEIKDVDANFVIMHQS